MRQQYPESIYHVHAIMTSKKSYAASDLNRKAGSPIDMHKIIKADILLLFRKFIWLKLFTAISLFSGHVHALELKMTDFLSPLAASNAKSLSSGPRLRQDGGVECKVINEGIGISNHLTLAKAVDLALCHNPEIKAALSNTRVQSSNAAASNASYYPAINGSIGHANTTAANTDPFGAKIGLNGLSASLVMNWRVWDGGVRDAMRESMNLAVRSAVYNSDAVVQRVVMSVISSYFSAQDAENTVSASDESVAISESILDTVQRRKQNGAASESDYLQASASLQKSQLARSRAFAESGKSKATLAQTIGLLSGNLRIQSQQEELQHIRGVANLSHWIERAKAQHPAIVAAEARVLSSKSKLKSISLEGMPSIDVSANVGRTFNAGVGAKSSANSNVGLTVTVPIFDGNARFFKQKGQASQIEQNEAERDQVRHQVISDVERSYTALTSAVESYQSADRMLQAYALLYNSLMKRYENGAADVSELLIAKSQLTDARLEKLKATSDIGLFRVHLYSAAGVLGRGLIESYFLP